MLLRLLLASAALLSPCGFARAETVLEDLPIVVRSGLASGAGGPGERVLPDLPFSTEQGYGYVGGVPGRRVGAAAFGGDASWLLAWREGIEKYVFRLPRGEYDVELSFIETDVASKGHRVFDVLAEEKPLFHQVDIARDAGDFAWHTLVGRVGVFDGWLDLRFIPTGGERPPRVSRIRISAPREGVVAAATTPFSPVEAVSLPQDLGLKRYELKIPEEELARISVRQDPPLEAPAELHFQNNVDYVLVSLDTDPGRWQRKKSYQLLPDPLRDRRVLGRKGTYLSAEAGDPTLLRALVSAGASTALGIATPAVDPVLLLVNGKYQGVYLDTELLDRRFRLRSRLDRVGTLALSTRGDQLALDWAPYGEQRGEEGNILGLTELVHELNRLGEGEMPRFFEERFYLDRQIDRTAFLLLRGTSPERRLLLKDSRNGKWELLEERQPNGSLGIRDFSLETQPLTELETRRLVLGESLQAGLGSRGGASVLDTRIASRPDLGRRVAERFEGLLAGPLSPEKLDALIDKEFERIRAAAMLDPFRWPQDGGKAFLTGPARMKEAYRSRTAAMKTALRLQLEQKPAPVVLSEVCASPAEGAPWIEVRNASAEPQQLEGYFLSDDFRPPSYRLPLSAAAPLAAGAFVTVSAAGQPRFPLHPYGGFLALWRQRGAAPPELCDSIFYGHQSKGIAYGRIDPDSWAFLSPPTPGTANEARRLVPPPYEFRQGVTKEKNGNLRIWIKPRPNEAAGEKRPEKVVLRYRPDGDGDFQSVDLVWDDTAFQFSVGLEASSDRKRTAYYFESLSQDGVERVYPLPAPELTFFLPILPGVKLNEVLPRPGRAPGTPGEFIEVYNPGTEPIDLEGYFLSDSNRNPTRWRIPAGNVVPPKGFSVFYADGANRGNHAGFRLSNSGEFLGLFGRMEEGNLPADTLAFRGVRTGESWGANPDGSKSFRAWKDPTPGGRNIPKIPEEYLKKRRGEAGEPPNVDPLPKPRDSELDPVPPEPDEDEDEPELKQ